ncbi:MAG: hypothetical protein HY318_01425, partial [Armatimonadetes bacterium]|nr:hypothetical protein [Armatimonadota bacterium]
MPTELVARTKSIFHPARMRLQLPQPEPVTPGLYHFTREVDGFPSRFHLRIDPDGHGLLIANASMACRLSPSGVFMARSLLSKEEKGWTFTQMAQRFRGVSRRQLEKDYETLHRFIHSLAAPGDNYPITNLDDPWAMPHARQLSAPLRADMPVGKDAEEAGIQILHR